MDSRFFSWQNLDSDSDVDRSEEDDDYEEFMKKAKRHRQYKTKRKEKADAALVEAEKTQGKKADAETSSMPVFALFSTIKVIFFFPFPSSEISSRFSFFFLKNPSPLCPPSFFLSS